VGEIVGVECLGFLRGATVPSIPSKVRLLAFATDPVIDPFEPSADSN
jgi:hypothetical protein